MGGLPSSLSTTDTTCPSAETIVPSVREESAANNDDPFPNLGTMFTSGADAKK